MQMAGGNVKSIEEIRRKLFVLRNFEPVFRGETVRQQKPVCCGRELGLGELLKTMVRPADVEIDGNSYTLFEVTCPTCGAIIAPKWDVRK